jgi:hypothetical protein
MRLQYISNIASRAARAISSLLPSAGAARLPGLPGLKEKGDKELRIRRVTGSLSEATNLIKQIELEIECKKAEVFKLQRNIETCSKVTLLKQSDVAAVVNLLRHELIRERRWSFCENAILHFIFFVLGIVASFLLIH